MSKAIYIIKILAMFGNVRPYKEGIWFERAFKWPGLARHRPLLNAKVQKEGLKYKGKKITTFVGGCDYIL